MKKAKESAQPGYQVLLENVYYPDRIGRLKRTYELILPFETLVQPRSTTRGEKC